VADTEVTGVFKSRFVKQSFIISDITKVDEGEFLEELISLAKKMNCEQEKAVVFSGKDDYLLFFSKHYDVLSRYFDLSFESDFDILNAAMSKSQLVDIANRAGVLIPKSFTSLAEFHNNESDLSYPLIIKPAIKHSPELNVEEAAFRLKICYSKRDVEKASEELIALNCPFVIQDYIPGDDNELYTFGSYAYKGSIKAWATSKKLRQFPPNTGQCSYGKTMYVPELYEPSFSLLNTLGFTGVTQIEYKKYEGRYYLIEINPRIWAWHHINLKIGVNLSKVAVDHTNSEEYRDVIEPERNEKYWMFFMMDLLHNRLLNKNVSYWRLFKELLTCDAEAFFERGDFSVSWYHSRKTVGYIRRMLKEQRKF